MNDNGGSSVIFWRFDDAMNLRCVILSMVIGSWIPHPLMAQPAIWEITGANASTTNPRAATSLGTNITSASLTLGSGVTASNSGDTFGGSGFNSTTLSTAISGGDYLSFTITPADGFAISISSLSLNSGVSTAVTNFNVSLLSSATGFTGADSLYNYSFSTAGAPTQSITLTGVTALQNVSGSLEFRLYGWRDTAGTSTFRIRNLSGNDLVINGSVSAIPEPSAFAAAAGVLALSGVIWHRRRQGKLDVRV